MYLKIYFDNKPLFLCNEIDELIEPYVHHDDAIFIDELNTHTVKSMIHEMQQEKVHAGVFFHTDLEALKKEFYKRFSIVLAAGGLVQNASGQILMIFRRGKWDLPKGKLDDGESLENCALREVEEETGLQGVQGGESLITTRHTYHEGSRYILKESWWYRMKYPGAELPVPQTEEGITEIRWVNPAEARSLYPLCYPSVVDVLDLIAVVSE